MRERSPAMSDKPVVHTGPAPITGVANPNRVTASVAGLQDFVPFHSDHVDAIAEQMAG
jgi:hypothetical protein